MDWVYLRDLMIIRLLLAQSLFLLTLQVVLGVKLFGDPIPLKRLNTLGINSLKTNLKSTEHIGFTDKYSRHLLCSK